MMKRFGCNVVSLGIFSWSTLEPEEGVFHFEWLQEIIDKLYKRGISTILATPSGARPKWMADKYPEVLRVDETRHRALFGFRHNHCYTSPVYREKVHIINKKLAQEVATHPGVILWHISNEYGGKVVDFGEEHLTAEITGDSKKVESFIEKVRDFGILELSRSGEIAIGLGIDNTLCVDHNEE